VAVTAPVRSHCDFAAVRMSAAVLARLAKALAIAKDDDAADTPAGPPALTSLRDCFNPCAVSRHRSASSAASTNASSLCTLATMVGLGSHS
jgi:hypothetical protein